MFIPKRYGESKVDGCPFCGRQAIVKNSEGIPVCNDHKDKTLGDMKCTCGQYLLLQKGKFGPYFNCLKCGNVTLKRALEINPNIMHAEKAKGAIVGSQESQRNESRHQIIRSDDPRFFDD